MVNAMEWLYSQEEYNTKEKREKIEKLNIFFKDLEGDLDLREFVNLRELDCQHNQLTSLDVSDCGRLNDLYIDDKLFTENKITGLEKTSIVRLDCRGGDLLKKSQDLKFIWEVFVRKYNAAFPEMELLDIADLTEIAHQVNKETANNEEFLTKICPKEAKTFVEANKGDYYWILDQLANTILARCLVIQNRLYEGKDEEYEKHLEYLAQQSLKCNAMNPKNPTASLYENRKKLVNQALNGDLELLERLQDLPYLSPGYKKILTAKTQKLQQDNRDLLNDIHQYKQSIQELQRENQNLKTQIQKLTNKEAKNGDLPTEIERERKTTTLSNEQKQQNITRIENIRINADN